MTLIKGITVSLFEKTLIGTDGFNNAKYSEKEVQVENVLVEPTLQDDTVSATDLVGTKIVYRLCIPKGDTHEWRNSRVSFFGKTFKTFGPVIEYIDENVPLDWNRKVYCELYE